MPEDATQLSIGAENEPPKHRVEIVSGVLAGFRFPGRTLERLTTVQRREVTQIARDALQRLEEVE